KISPKITAMRSWAISKISTNAGRAFIFGLAFRLILEIINGKYPVGYDTNTHYILKYVKLDWIGEIRYGFLYQYIMFILAKATGNVFLAIKILACFLSGLFVLSLYMWGKYSGLDSNTALKFSYLCYLFFPVLRLMWDLHRNVMGLSLLLIGISLSKEKRWASYLLVFLAGITHPFTIFVMVSIGLIDLFRLRKNVVLLMASNIAGVSPIIAYRLIIGQQLSGYVSASGVYWCVPPEMVPLFVGWLALPLFVVIIARCKINKSCFARVFKNKYNTYWFVFSIIIAPLFIFAYRIALMAMIPLFFITFALVNGSKSYIKLLAIITILSSVVFAPLSYIYPVNPSFRYAMPPVPAGSTVFPWDMDDVEGLFRLAKNLLNNSSALIVQHLQIGIAYYAGINLNRENVIITEPDEKFDQYIDTALESYLLVLIVWYKKAIIGAWDIPRDGYNFSVFRESGSFSLYIYYR
ncbi:MAG: EpsG family protein, partial [Candidatus Njordarchaeota archaeon]